MSREAVQNVNKLTLKFTSAVAAAQDDKSDNVIFSSYNAQTCLAMVASGAEGGTKAEFAKTLFGLDDAGQLDKAVQDLATLNKTLLANNEGKVTLKTANAIWVNADHADLDPAFKANMEQTFGATVESKSFGPDVVDEINQWAADGTNNLITSIKEELSPDDYAVLAALLYFKGDWTNQFDTKETEDRAFTLDDGTVNLTPTMRQNFEEEGKVSYQKGGDYEAVSMTYGKLDRKSQLYPSMRLILVRPSDENVSARDWLAQKAGADEQEWLGHFRNAYGPVELPHLDIKQKHDLVPVLQSMGVKLAFDQTAADLSRMSSERLFISEVTQDVVFKTDEKGSEAAAVTQATATLECARPMPVAIDVKFNRSFVLALQDMQTRTVLFAGAVNKPNKDMKPAPAPAP